MLTDQSEIGQSLNFLVYFQSTVIINTVAKLGALKRAGSEFDCVINLQVTIAVAVSVVGISPSFSNNCRNCLQ